mgnify:CR=1 FL=1
MKEIPIGELIARCKSILEEGHYSRQRICRYEALWKKGILKYMSDQGLTLYSPEIGKACLTSYLCGHPNDHKEQELVRSVNVLDDCLLLGRIRMYNSDYKSNFKSVDSKISYNKLNFNDFKVLL